MFKILFKPSVIFLLFLLVTAGLHAQEAVIPSGGDASGSGGSMSCSVGQLFFLTSTGTDASVAEGVQQPFEISVVSSIEETAEWSLKIYPNPVSGIITVTTENIKNDRLWYRLYDTYGKLLESKKATGKQTQLDLTRYKPAVYFLKVTDQDKEIKTFKIVKH